MSVFLRIEDKLAEAFAPSHLEVVNESHMHGGAATESHFKVVLVSKQFDGLRLLNRHRAVNKVLADELMNDIHALALHTYTEHEWFDLFEGVPMSPPCMGGSKRDSRRS